MRVELLPTPAHRAERLERALAAAPAALAPVSWTLEELRDALCVRLLPGLKPAPEALERVVTFLALESQSDARGVGLLHGGTVASASATLDRLRRFDVSQEALSRAQDELSPEEAQPHRRLGLVASLAGETERLLERLGFVARGRVDALLARAMDGKDLARVLQLEGPLQLELAGLRAPEPSRVELLLALARAAGRSGGTLGVHLLCEPERLRSAPSVERALALFEAATDAPVELRLGLRNPALEAGETADFLRALACGGRASTEAVRLYECAGPAEQARQAAWCIERWLAEGHAPEELAVVLRERDSALLGSLRRALEDAGIPWRDGTRERLGERSLAAALLQLPALCAQGAPREAVLHTLAALAGQTVPVGRAAPYRMLEALRLLRVERWLDEALEPRLAALEAKGRLTGTLGAELRRWRELLRALSLDGTPREHVARLESLLLTAQAASHWWSECSAALTSGAGEAGGRELLETAARADSCLAATRSLLENLASWLEGLGVRALSATSFAAMAREAAAVWDLPAVGPSGGVCLLSAEQALGRELEAVVVVGVQQGGFPAFAEHEELLGEVELRALARATGRLQGGHRSPEEEALLFFSVLGSARSGLALLGCLHDAGGRLLPPSTLLVDARRALGRAPLRVHRDPMARRCEPPARGLDRQLRAWVGVGASAEARRAGAVRSARQRGVIEHERREFFHGRLAEPGRFSGRVAVDAAALEALGLARWATEERPLDVTALERAARCGFKTFARELLRLEAVVEEQAVLDPKDRGHLVHALVEKGQHTLQARGLATAAETWSQLRRALDEATEEFVRRHTSADPELVRAEGAALRQKVEAWLLGRLDIEERWEPVATEIAFGPNRDWSALAVPVEGQAPIVLRGRIDGVERMDGALRVVEFKSGRGDGYARRLKQGLLDTQFQLVVYAAALERAREEGRLQAPGSTQVDGVYVGFRELGEYGLREVLAPKKRGGDAEPVDVDAVLRAGARGQGALGDAVRKAVVPLRLGVFAPTPRDCHFCDAASLCRVDHSDRGGEE